MLKGVLEYEIEKTRILQRYATWYESDLSILNFIRKGKEKEKCQYLREGRILVAYGGIVQDVINPQNGGAGCPDMITDVIWMWPGDLAYYVKQYNLKLDKYFIKTMRDNYLQVNGIADFDFDYIEII